MQLGTLWGVRIKLNLLFVLFIGFWAVTGSLLEIGLICLIVLVHEMAHALVARAMHLHVQEVELYPFGGVARIDEPLELEPFVERRLAWAGPLTNLALAGVAVVLMNRGILPYSALLFFLQANLAIAFFNLLPVLPLDGGRILRSYLSPLLGYRLATEKAATAGQALAILMALAALPGWYYKILNPSIIPLAVFLFLAATREKRGAIYAFLRSLGTKERELGRRGGLRGELLVVLEGTRLLDVFRLFTPHRYHYVRILDSKQRPLAEISESVLIEAAVKKGLDIPVKKIL